MLKESNLQFKLKMVYQIFKSKKNVLLISNIECTWPSAKISNSVFRVKRKNLESRELKSSKQPEPKNSYFKNKKI